MIDYHIYSYGINLIDSYKVKKTEDMKTILVNIFKDEKMSKDFDRTIANCIAEWKFHNICWYLHIMRNRAKDTFLDKNFKGFRGIIEKLLYSIISIFYLKYN